MDFDKTHTFPMRLRAALAALLIAAVALSSASCSSTPASAGMPSGAAPAQTSSEQVSSAPPPTITVTFTDLNSDYALLTRLSDGLVVYEQQTDEQAYPASLTKMMTAIVAIESIDDLETEITLSSDIFPPLREASASLAGFSAGETLTALDLLYGALLPSGAECCVGLAEYISGSEEAFVEKMNAKAAELGMTGTHFVNATGLHDDAHYSTARDLTKLLSYALENDTFRTIFTTRRYSIPPTNKHKNGVTLYSSTLQNIETTVIDGGTLLGGKTGYTKKAGQCLASLAEKDGEEYILITFHAQNDEDEERGALHLEDALTVFNGFTVEDHD